MSPQAVQEAPNHTDNGATAESGLITGANGAGSAADVRLPRPVLTSINVVIASRAAAQVATNVVQLSDVRIADEVALTVSGDQFVAESRIRLDGRDLPTGVLSATSLSATLTPAYLSKPGEHRVTVVTPGPGGGVSKPLPLFAEPEPQWGMLEKGLVLGAFVAAALWILWMISAPAAGAASTDEPSNWQLTWFTMIVILTAFTLGVGRALTGTWKSLLIDERNKQSLSRLQLVLWTILTTSAIIAAVAWNIHRHDTDPMGIHVPMELWILMGISATALVGSNFIKGQQTGITLGSGEADARLQEIRQGDLDSQRVLATNASQTQARWTDMFRNEGIDAGHTLDIGKIQLFLFTIISVLAYAATFARMAYHPATDTLPARFEFPALENSFIALLGVSSFFYLANKAGKQLGSG
ncbi:MAG: hypothetical protein U0031_06870 [Thermomicrobiales bacterium]